MRNCFRGRAHRYLWQNRRHRLVIQLLQHRMHRLPQWFLDQSIAQWIHRNEPPHVQADPVLMWLNYFIIRMIQKKLALFFFDPTEKHNLLAHGKSLDHPRHVEPPAMNRTG